MGEWNPCLLGWGVLGTAARLWGGINARAKVGGSGVGFWLRCRCGGSKVEFLSCAADRSELPHEPAPSVSVFKGTAIPWHSKVASPPDRGLDIIDD